MLFWNCIFLPRVMLEKWINLPIIYYKSNANLLMESNCLECLQQFAVRLYSWRVLSNNFGLTEVLWEEERVRTQILITDLLKKISDPSSSLNSVFLTCSFFFFFQTIPWTKEGQLTQLHVYKPVCEVSEKRTSPTPAAAQQQHPLVQLSHCLAPQDMNMLLTVSTQQNKGTSVVFTGSTVCYC